VTEFTCSKSSTGFSLILPSGYQFTSGQASNNMTSNAYTCSESSTNGPNDTVNCTGTVPPNSTSYVQTGTSPNPQAGMSLQLNVSFTDGSTTSFTVTSK
jgi:hypothetical protein